MSLVAHLRFPLNLWHGRLPFATLVWRHMLVIGSAINLLGSMGALALLALGMDAVWAVALHFAPLPWNAFLLAAVWRHRQTTVLWSGVALAWFVGMLVL